MSRFRLYPAPDQELALLRHCAHARFVWNLAVEQHSWWTPRRGPAPGYTEQSRQLTEARATFPWLSDGSQTVQQQALRDFALAMSWFFNGTHRKPTWRKAGKHEGFRIVGPQAQKTRRLSKRVGQVWVPKAGWVKFRWSRETAHAKSYRITRDRAGRWHLGLALAPDPLPAPGNGRVVGVDRGVVVSAALSTGQLLCCPTLPPGQAGRLKRLQRRLRHAQKGSTRSGAIRLTIAKLRAREVDIRRNWVEQTSTDLARRFDVICFEDLNIRNMTASAKGTVRHPGTGVRAKASLNREILRSGWGRLLERTEQKAPGRVLRVNPAYTSQTCSRCGNQAARNRESQSAFACRSCGYREHADVNAARNIAAGHAVTARGGARLRAPTNREPQSKTSCRMVVG